MAKPLKELVQDVIDARNSYEKEGRAFYRGEDAPQLYRAAVLREEAAFKELIAAKKALRQGLSEHAGVSLDILQGLLS